MLLLVYGTLKRGFRNAALLASAKFIGDAVTQDAFVMLSVGGAYPAVSDVRAEAPVAGEVYKVGPETLRACDRLEGHPHYYRRRLVAARVAERERRVWMYIIRSARPCLPPDADEQIGLRNGCFQWRKTR